MARPDPMEVIAISCAIALPLIIAGYMVLEEKRRAEIAAVRVELKPAIMPEAK